MSSEILFLQTSIPSETSMVVVAEGIPQWPVAWQKNKETEYINLADLLKDHTSALQNS